LDQIHQKRSHSFISLPATITMKFSVLAVSLIVGQAAAFGPLLRPKLGTFNSQICVEEGDLHQPTDNYGFQRRMPLFMGRAAAVRAATKNKTDAKKAKTNAVYGKKLIMAVKQGGSPDPKANKALADVIKGAKANSVPVDNINRAIKKASEGNVGDFKEATFEAYGFGGVSLIINVLTDNNNRATSDVRTAVNKRDGKIAESGSVLFMYDRKGMIEVQQDLDEEAVLEAAIEAGCDDYELSAGDVEGTTILYTDPSEVSMMFEALKSLGCDAGAKMSLTYVTKAPVECSDEDFDKNMDIIEALEDLDDVDSVEHNMSN
jgi:YebC/PmpR family DNA-binding regulatory protein